MSDTTSAEFTVPLPTLARCRATTCASAEFFDLTTMFGRAGIADGGSGNPNFSAWTAQVGIGGDSVLRHRQPQGDRWGIGYNYTATSSEWGPIPRALFGPRDAQAVELYYRYHLTPYVEITPDVQWVSGVLGGLTNGDDAVIGGIRMNIIL